MDGYPKVKYHKLGGGSICVVSAEQEKALGADWLDVKPFTPIVKVEDKRGLNESSGPNIKLTAINRSAVIGRNANKR